MRKRIYSSISIFKYIYPVVFVVVVSINLSFSVRRGSNVCISMIMCKYTHKQSLLGQPQPLDNTHHCDSWTIIISTNDNKSYIALLPLCSCLYLSIYLSR